MDEIAELREALDRLHATMDDLIVRGVRAIGPAEMNKLTALRDEFRTAGAEHIADRLSRLLAGLTSGDRSAATELMRAITAAKLFDRMLTLEVAQGILSRETEGA